MGLVLKSALEEVLRGMQFSLYAASFFAIMEISVVT